MGATIVSMHPFGARRAAQSDAWRASALSWMVRGEGEGQKDRYLAG
jgi:hypothetical protein